MDKNDPFHGEEFEVNAQAVSDEELAAVAGGHGISETPDWQEGKTSVGAIAEA